MPSTFARMCEWYLSVFFSSRRRHTRCSRDWSSDVCSSDLVKVPAAVRFLSVEPLLGPISQLPLDGIDWVIVGGESGPGHRLIKPEWVRDIRDQCAGAKVAFFFKQWGGPRPTSGGRLLDGRVWSEMPAAQKRVGCSSS